jgi:hypothetical protein
MAVGLPVTKQEIDNRAGDMARAFQRLAGDVTTLKGFLDSSDEASLVELGYTPNEIAILKSGISDLEQLVVQIGSGNQALPEPKNFTQFLRQLWGVGAF